MTCYIVKLEDVKVTEEFGTWSDDDPYDHYLGDCVERTNMRVYIIKGDEELDHVIDTYIPDDPYCYTDVKVLCSLTDEEFKLLMDEAMVEIVDVTE